LSSFAGAFRIAGCWNSQLAQTINILFAFNDQHRASSGDGLNQFRIFIQNAPDVFDTADPVAMTVRVLLKEFFARSPNLTK
jgi:hypothetical protein